MAWFQAHPAPGGTTLSARAWACPVVRARPATARARTRAALVSTTPTSRSKANASTARAL